MDKEDISSAHISVGLGAVQWHTVPPQGDYSCLSINYVRHKVGKRCVIVLIVFVVVVGVEAGKLLGIKLFPLLLFSFPLCVPWTLNCRNESSTFVSGVASVRKFQPLECPVDCKDQPQQPWKFVCRVIAGLPHHRPPPSDTEIESTRQVGEEWMGVNQKEREPGWDAWQRKMYAFR